MMSSSADTFTEAYQAAGGDSTIVRLPDEGIKGNDHFMFQDLNNDVIANHVEDWIKNHTGANSGTNASNQTAAPTSSTSGTSDDSNNSETNNGKTLIAYYSATGSTQAVAEIISNTLNGELFEIMPAQTYTSDDLNWTDSNSRVSREHEDPALRDVELVTSTVDNWDSYDTVFIGYPIWWGIAAWPVDNFIKANDFTDKTVIPFCTSSSSGLGQSGQLLADLAGTGDWQEGRRFQSSVSESDVISWVQSLDLSQDAN